MTRTGAFAKAKIGTFAGSASAFDAPHMEGAAGESDMLPASFAIPGQGIAPAGEPGSRACVQQTFASDAV